MNQLEMAMALCRLLQDASALLLWGGFGYLATLVPEGLALDFERRFDRYDKLAVGVLLLATLAALPLQSAGSGNGWVDALDLKTIRAVLCDTGFGRDWLVQTLLVAFLLMVPLIAAPCRFRQRSIATIAMLLLVSFAFRGHAVMQTGLPGLAHRLNAIVHVLAAGAWLGALVPLLPILAALERAERRTESITALRRFSTAGHVAVALVIGSGIVNTALTLGRWPIDRGAPYELLLVFKIVLVAAMVALAVFNRYALVPRLSPSRPGVLRTIRRATYAEIALGVGAIALVALFSLLDPS
ncbi:MAG: copper resistance D family protein [Variovorax sp.]|nr:MAG: copper resistance D family protein [Variovorax sp.]